MLDSIGRLLSTDGFMPHGMCYLWRPGVLGLHVLSDALITLAYFSIPFTLLYFVRKRTDLQFNWMFVCFAIFIVACGTTHLMAIWTIWYPVYWLSGSIKALTALASVPTAVLLVRLVPQALRLPSPSALQRANASLEREVAERKRAEEEVRRVNAELGVRVAERTSQLEAANRDLLREIAERQAAEERLRASQEFLQAIVDTSPAVIYVKDLEGRYLLANRRFEEITRLPAHAIQGKTDHELFAEPAADAFRAMDRRVAAAGRALTEEEQTPQADGVHAYVSVKAPLRDDLGRIYAVLGVSTDITQRKLAEERLRAQLERLSLLDRTTRAIGERQDLHSIFRVVLQSLEEHLHVDFACACLREPGQEALTVSCVGTSGEPLARQLSLGEQARIAIDQNGLRRCLQGELVHEPDISCSQFPFPARLAEGGLRALVIAPLSLESQVFGVMIAARRVPGSFASGECEFLRQLSQHVALAVHQAQLYAALQRAYEDLRQTQQTILQQERLRALGQMASGIAHDINNALSPASVYAQLLLGHERGLSDEAREYLVIMQRAIEDVAHTVARMREFSRPREPQPRLSAVEVNRTLSQVIDLTRARWSDMPQERGIVVRVATDFAPDLPVITGADSEIRDALTNLVLNAVDAMPAGGTLTLRTRSLAPPKPLEAAGSAPGRVVVEVCDTGIGMSESTRRQCLEPFFTTKGERGTGLGLAMVYGMAQRHGAEIEIESEPGEGTTLRLVFPAATESVSVAASSETRRPARGLRILLVDDDPLIIRAMCDTLESDGQLVTAADGGQAGIDAFFQAAGCGRPFDVVITDLGMPHVDGRAVAAAIKARSPETPVILLTGWGHRLLEENDFPPQVDRVIGKPPKLGELRALLAELTKQR